MALEPWYKAVIPRREVREGRSFNPDEVAIALEQGVAGTAPPDYHTPRRFSSAPASRGRCGTRRGWCCGGWPGRPGTRRP